MTPSDEILYSIVLEFSKSLQRNKNKLVIFSKNGRQLEGWFKGEIIYFLEKKKKDKIIRDFKTEYCFIDEGSNSKFDFMITIENGKADVNALIELKHLTDKQNLRSYFLSGNGGEYPWKMEKMLKLSIMENYFLVFFTKKPKPDSWDRMICDFHEKFFGFSIRSLTNPDDFPDFVFPALIKIEKTLTRRKTAFGASVLTARPSYP